MDAERFSAYYLSVNSGRIGEPVVSVDDIKLLRASQNTCDDREVVYLVVQVAGIATCKAHAAKVI